MIKGTCDRRALEAECVTHSQALAGFGGLDGGVDRETVKMIETLRIRPGGEVLAAQLCEFLLKFGDRFAAVRIPGRNHVRVHSSCMFVGDKVFSTLLSSPAAAL